MTARQIGAITILAVAVIVVFTILGYLILNTPLTTATPTALPTQVAARPTAAPTHTPPPPTPTATTPGTTGLPPTNSPLRGENNPASSPAGETEGGPSAKAGTTAPTAPAPPPDPAPATKPEPASLDELARRQPLPDRPPLPARLIIPAIAVDAPIVSVGLEPSGIMASPAQAHQVGWYQLGPRPGDPSNAVLAGHSTWMQQPGAFARLAELQPGDKVQVESGPGIRYDYVVQDSQVYNNDTAPIAQIFAASPMPMLTMITCVGAYDADRQEYQDRLVVYALGE